MPVCAHVPSFSRRLVCRPLYPAPQEEGTEQMLIDVVFNESRSLPPNRRRREFVKNTHRRRVASNRSLSITGLPATGLSGLDRASLSNLSASLVRSALRLTTASSTQDLHGGGSSGVSEAQRHSIAESLSRVLAPYCLGAAANVANATADGGSGVPQSPAGNSRATSVLGESRRSTSSAPIDQQQQLRGSSGSINTWRRLSGLHAAPPLPTATGTAAGSRMSLRSLSYASSTGSGAQSYNSFQLLAEHAGASWRELWRTRMLLMDVLRWAQAVSQTTNSNSALGGAGSTSYYPGTTTVGDQGNCATNISANEMQQPPPTSAGAAAADEAAADWTNQLSAMVMYLLGQVQQQQQQQQPEEPPPPTGDPVLMAALVAATAAASAAMQQQQQQQQQQDYNRQRFPEGQPPPPPPPQPPTATTTITMGAEHAVGKSPGGTGSATTVTAPAGAAASPYALSSPHFASPSAVYPPQPNLPYYQLHQSPRFPAPICVGAAAAGGVTASPVMQFCQRGPPDLLADAHRAAFAQAAAAAQARAAAEENVCHLDAASATPSANFQPQLALPMWGPGSPQAATGVSPASMGGGGGWPRAYPPMPTLYAPPAGVPAPPPQPLRHYSSPSQQWAAACAASVPRHCYPTAVWQHQPVEATPPHLVAPPPSQALLANVSSGAMLPYGPSLTAFPAPTLIPPSRGGASPSTAAPAVSLSRWPVRPRRRTRKKTSPATTPNDGGSGGGGGMRRSHEDSDAFDSEDEIISDTDEKATATAAAGDPVVAVAGGSADPEQLRAAVLQAAAAAAASASSSAPWPGCCLVDEGDSTGYSEAFEAIGSSTRPETEEDDGDISSVSQSASQVVPVCAKPTLSQPLPKQQEPSTAADDPAATAAAAAAAPHVPDAEEAAHHDR